MTSFPSPEHLSPTDFELLVKQWLEESAGELDGFHATHLEKCQGHDGEYAIDVAAEFRVFGGARVRVIVECKKYRNPIKREVVQVLREKLLSLGAQKAILVSTSSFQSGAIEYAAAHGVALIQVVSGSIRFIQNRAVGTMGGAITSQAAIESRIAKSVQTEPFVGLFYGGNPQGKLVFPQLIAKSFVFELERHLKV